jgi:ParB-like chromosome segregation protein Spo0J
MPLTLTVGVSSEVPTTLVADNVQASRVTPQSLAQIVQSIRDFGFAQASA